jgi:hypothetical protein
MFYCEPCRAERDWPEAFSRSGGPCEICGVVRECYNVHSSRLPLPKGDPKSLPLQAYVLETRPGDGNHSITIVLATSESHAKNLCYPGIPFYKNKGPQVMLSIPVGGSVVRHPGQVYCHTYKEVSEIVGPKVGDKYVNKCNGGTVVLTYVGDRSIGYQYEGDDSFSSSPRGTFSESFRRKT